MAAIPENLFDADVVAKRNLVVQACKKNYWLFDIESKEWFTPEEFDLRFTPEQYEKGWHKRIKVLDPLDGLKAAEIQTQKIAEKRLVLQARIIKYYQKKK